MDQVPPYEPEAEQRLLGAMLWTVDARDVVLARLAATDFYLPQHQELFAAIAMLHEDGDAVTDITVLSRAKAAQFDHVEAHLLAGCREATAATGWSSLAALVADAAAKRRAIHEAVNIVEAANHPSTSSQELANLVDGLVDRIQFPMTMMDPGPGIKEFLGRTDDEPDWVVTGLLERTDRCIVTGWMEGGGKSTMQRQIAVQAAAGIIPFTARIRQPPVRVLIVDCENPEGIVRRKMRPLVLSAGDALDDPMRLVVHCRPEGLDLLNQRDRQWLAGLVEANGPDLVMLGPLYKLHEDDPTSERPARSLAAYLDRLRIRHTFALVIEAHTPQEAQGQKRPLRPYGASLWRRWPELGLGIQKNDDGAYHLVRWRDERDDREWPRTLARGGVWPWSSGGADHFYDQHDDDEGLL